MARPRVSDICLVAKCDRKTVARGLCGMHWRRSREHGMFGKDVADAARAYRVAAGLKRWRNMTPEEFDALLASQGGGCGLCGKKPPAEGRRWPVDHDHDCCPDTKSCGRCTRGILCHTCNIGMGAVDRTPGWLDKARAYQAKWRYPRLFDEGAA